MDSTCMNILDVHFCTVCVLLQCSVPVRLCAGHQRGGTGAAGQHDDRDGWHRKQM